MIEALLLVAQVTIGAQTCVAPAGTYVWQIQYRDLTYKSYATTDGKLTFAPRSNRDWRARHTFNGSAFSPWTRWIPGAQFPGDSDGDCLVGGNDLLMTGSQWGTSCPP